MINVGVDATDFRPINADQISELIADGPSSRHARSAT